MIFYKSSRDREREANRWTSSTMSLYSMKLANEERCAHFLALLGLMCLIVSAVMLYFAIVTQYSEQKTIYYIVFVVGVLAVFFFGGLAWFLLSRIAEKRECFWHVQMNTQAIRRQTRMKQEELNETRLSQSQLNRPPSVLKAPTPTPTPSRPASGYFINQNYQPESVQQQQRPQPQRPQQQQPAPAPRRERLQPRL